MGMPSAFLIERTGYEQAIMTGLMAMAMSALSMILAARMLFYE